MFTSKDVTQESSESFGELLRDFRLAAGLSQESLAERTQLSLGGISVLERGARRSPHRETVALLADGLHLSITDRARLEAAAWRRPKPRRRKAGGLQPSHNLPAELTSFVGRATEINEIGAFLKTRFLVTLLGTGGVGKTRTALRVARAIADGGTATWFVDLSTITEPSTSVACSIAQAIGLEESTSRSAIRALISYFARTSVLLVLDNCERVTSEVANVVYEIGRASATVRILATSREPLRVEGEQVYRLPSLTTSEALELFSERAGKADHRFNITDENRSTVVRICDRLDGIPLAIELAAARIGVLPPKALYEKLDRRFAVLTSSNQDGSPRQRTMRALIDWSYDLLSTREQKIFEQLSVFAGGCTLEAASSVCDADDIDESGVFDVVASLVDKSLLATAADGEEPRYVMLESVRDYAREKLAQRGHLAQTAHRHAFAYYQIASQLKLDEPFPTELTCEIENWHAALDWTLNSGGDPELGLRLVGILTPIWSRLAPSDGRYWLPRAFKYVDERTPLSVLARLEYAEAKIAEQFSEKTRTVDTGTRALEHFQMLGDFLGIAQTQRVVGYALIKLGRLDEGEGLLSDALDAARRYGFRWVEASSLGMLGLAHSYMRDFDKADRYFSEAIAMYTRLGDDKAAAATACNFAEAKFIAGDPSSAIELVKRGIEASGGLEYVGVPALTNLIAYLIALSRYDEARSHALAALKLAHQLGMNLTLRFNLQHLAAIAILRPRDPANAGGRVDAARLLGFVDSQLESLSAPRQFTEQQEYDRAIAVLREEIGSERTTALMASGTLMTENQAVELANSLNLLSPSALDASTISKGEVTL